ncbi:hypothetical protein B296_00038643 [Ensete ventricosum]|uniref:Ferric oxidoreductase domain-containing protein n=1 Tax=Ensete ventricosum TaxID=4639 RepID=A0A426YXC1_ENSVE|nr:hypothetical protein B296_00038643 [Ensete ventricosum]
MDTAAVGGFPPRNGRKGLVLKALQLLAAAVFAGWLMIWIVMPTNTYRNGWSLRIRAETDSTYFGRQGVVLLLSFFDADELAKNSSLYKFSITPTTGFCILILCALYGAGTNILINTFPILFISVLGCLYLHLVKRSGTSQRYTIHQLGSSSDSMEEVCGCELAAWNSLRRRVNLLLDVSDCGAYVYIYIWGRWQARLDMAALWLGIVGDLCCAFLFFPVARGSSLLPLLGLTSESSIRYHVWLGHITMAVFSAHGVCYIVYWAVTDQIDMVLTTSCLLSLYIPTTCQVDLFTGERDIS